MKKTPIYDQHIAAGGKMIPFGDWSLPVAYGSVIEEHKAVREHCGLFDVSHMGEIEVSGEQASEFVDFALTGPVGRLSIGNGLYTMLCNTDGGVIDDLIIYRIESQKFLLCVNANNTQASFNHLIKISSEFEVNVENKSESYAQFALQGPKSKEALQSWLTQSEFDVIASLPYAGLAETTSHDRKFLIARTGYTGELGFELYLPVEFANEFWQELTSIPSVRPIGLGARDTLRLEVCYPLHGNELSESISPVKAGLGWAVDWKKDRFIGKEALVNEKTTGPQQVLRAFVMDEPGIGRAGMTVFSESEEAGIITSGSFLPSLEKSGGLALIHKKYAEIGSPIQIEIRGKRKLATIVRRPLYSPRTKT